MTRRSPRHERPQKNGIILGGTRSDGSLRWDEWVCGQCMKTNWLCSTACRRRGCQGRPSPAQIAAGAGVRSNVSLSKWGEEIVAGAKQGTAFTSPSSTVAGSRRGSIGSTAAQEVKTRITKLEALLKCARDPQDEDVIRATELKLSAAHAERVCARKVGVQLDQAMAVMEKAKFRAAKADDAVAKAAENQQAAKKALAEAEAQVAKVREAAATAQAESDSPPATQATDPELTRLVQIAEAMKDQAADLPKAGQDAIQQLAEVLRKQATARAPVRGRRKTRRTKRCRYRRWTSRRNLRCTSVDATLQAAARTETRCSAKCSRNVAAVDWVRCSGESSPRLRLHAGIPGRRSP